MNIERRVQFQEPLNSIPIQFFEQKGRYSSVWIHHPQYNSEMIKPYSNQFDLPIFAEKQIPTLKIQSRSLQVQVMSKFCFKKLLMLVQDISRYFYRVFDLQPTIEEIEIYFQNNYQIKDMSDFLCNQDKMVNLKHLSLSIFQQMIEKDKFKNSLGRFIRNQMDTLNSLHLCMDIINMFHTIKLCNKSTNQDNRSDSLKDTLSEQFKVTLSESLKDDTLLEQIKENPLQQLKDISSDEQLEDALYKQLTDITLNFQPLQISQVDYFLQEESQQNDNNFLQTFISQLKGLTTLRLYFAQSLLNIATYQSIFKVIEKQVEYDQIQNLTLCISQSRIQFDLLPLMQIIQRLSNLKKLELKLNFTTQVYMSKGEEERLRFPQIEDVNLSFIYCPCSNAILQQLQFVNLIRLQVDFSYILNSEHLTENMKLLTSWIEENTRLEDIRINIGQAAVIENQICDDVIQAITDKAHQLKNVQLNGFNSDLMNDRTIGMFKYVAICEMNFLNSYKIYKTKNSLQISQVNFYGVEIDLEIVRKLMQLTKGSINEYQFNITFRFENANLSLEEKSQSIIDLITPFNSLSKINFRISNEIPFTPQFFDQIIHYVKTSDLITSFNFYIGQTVDYKLNKLQRLQIQNLLSEKINLQVLNLNYNTNKYINKQNEIIQPRKHLFSRVIQSAKLVKQININKLFRQEIINEMIEFAFLRRLQD